MSANDKKWFSERCEQGCEICGRKLPRRKNHGMKVSHIVSKKDGGSDRKGNILALCPTCADSFDLVLKPALYEALSTVNGGKVPKSWRDGESRTSEFD